MSPHFCVLQCIYNSYSTLVQNHLNMINVYEVNGLAPLTRQSNIINFKVRSFRVQLFNGLACLRYCSTIRTYQIVVYLGREGFSSKTPFGSLQTRGFSPNLIPWSGSTMQNVQC